MYLLPSKQGAPVKSSPLVVLPFTPDTWTLFEDWGESISAKRNVCVRVPGTARPWRVCGPPKRGLIVVVPCVFHIRLRFSS